MKWKADVHNWITDENDKIIAAVNNKEDMPIIAVAPEMYNLLYSLKDFVSDENEEIINKLLAKAEKGRVE